MVRASPTGSSTPGKNSSPALPFLDWALRQIPRARWLPLLRDFEWWIAILRATRRVIIKRLAYDGTCQTGRFRASVSELMDVDFFRGDIGSFLMHVGWAHC
jgi:hypothetical protein